MAVRKIVQLPLHVRECPLCLRNVRTNHFAASLAFWIVVFESVDAVQFTGFAFHSNAVG